VARQPRAEGGPAADEAATRPRRVAEFFDYVATLQIEDFQVLDMLASDR
jgi:hypothetical protein